VGLLQKALAFVRERTGIGDGTPRTIVGGPSIAYVFGWVIVFLILLEVVTGAALAAFYSPSSTSAWASVAYIEDQTDLGWLVRGLHHHGGGAMAIVCGLHLVQTALFGAYKKPRELTWWLGVILMALVMAWSVTGYVLRWDQAGYWANRVEVGIAAGTPLIGDKIRALAIGGNDYGNLTLTRFYALHIIVLPILVGLLVGVHIWLARRHGTTPRAARENLPAQPRWPGQALWNVAAMAVAFGVLAIYTSGHHADLAGPANLSEAYDARPLWYFRWLYELRVIAGSMEKPVALAAPAVVLGFLIALPLLDGHGDRAVRARQTWLTATAIVLALVSGLTLSSFRRDAANEDLQKRLDVLEQRGKQARALAMKYGVPSSGGLDVFATPPMYRARQLFEQRCKSCHDAQSKERKGPIIAIGHGNRAWIAGFLTQPSGDAFWGKTKLGATDDAMKAVELPPGDQSDVIEYLYGQSGAADAKADAQARGKVVFDKACTDCHTVDESVAGASGPNLAGLGSRDYYTSFIGNPKSAVHMGDGKSQMPRFDKELSIVDRDLIAAYLVWLRTATPTDVTALGAL
jgi:ubiquinol-cytochrome c reductase cytochrome b subunit